MSMSVNWDPKDFHVYGELAFSVITKGLIVNFYLTEYTTVVPS